MARARFVTFTKGTSSVAPEAALKSTPEVSALWRAVEVGHLVREDVLPHSGTGLDLGCGDGRVTRLVRDELGARWTLTGLDPDELELELATSAGIYDVLLRADGGDVEAADESFDFVFSHIVFQHLPRKAYVEAYFRDAFRLLAPGGIFRVQVDGRSRQFFRRWVADSWSGVVFSARELSRRLERCGFRVVETRGSGTQYLRATAVKPG